MLQQRCASAAAYTMMGFGSQQQFDQQFKAVGIGKLFCHSATARVAFAMAEPREWFWGGRSGKPALRQEGRSKLRTINRSNCVLCTMDFRGRVLVYKGLRWVPNLRSLHPQLLPTMATTNKRKGI